MDRTRGEVEKEKGNELHLFEAHGVRNKALWQCIRYIAPNATKKKWKSTDAIGVYCTVCKAKVMYDSIKNPLGIKRHMDKYHKKLLDEYAKKSEGDGGHKKRKVIGVDAYFPKKPKTHHRIANDVNQKEFCRLTARWTSMSLRPFAIVEDEKLQDMIDFANSVHGALKLPSRNTNRKYVMEERLKNHVEGNDG